MRVASAVIGASLVLALGGSPSFAADRVRFGTSWLAEPEHGGFYQAVADGTYAKYGLDVTIVPGGPQANNEILLPVGKLDFFMGDNLIQAYSAVEQNIPTVVVAAFFQKDPQIVMSHPNVGLDTFASLKAAPIFISKQSIGSFYRWMVNQWGFSEDMIRPYTFNTGPFLADTKVVQQGYLSSEPNAVEKQGHFTPNVFLLADQGFSTYANTVEARTDTVAKNPDLVQRFVDASTIGWYNYLYGDNSKANEAIKRDNPEMDDQQIAYSIAKLKQYGIVDSGDTAELGIGGMTEARNKDFFDKMVGAGVVQANLDYRKAYTMQFVNKKVGLDLRPKATPAAQ